LPYVVHGLAVRESPCATFGAGVMQFAKIFNAYHAPTKPFQQFRCFRKRRQRPLLMPKVRIDDSEVMQFPQRSQQFVGTLPLHFQLVQRITQVPTDRRIADRHFASLADGGNVDFVVHAHRITPASSRVLPSSSDSTQAAELPSMSAASQLPS
jgi:hypothetical protein